MSEELITEPPKRAKASGPRIIPGLNLPPAAREKLEEQAFIVPTRPEEQRRQEAARTQLKAAEPRVEAEIIRVPKNADSVHISADDLANEPYGGMSRAFSVGDKALLLQGAGERLAAAGWVRLL